MADKNRVTQLTDKYYLVRDAYQMWISVKANGPKGEYFKRVTGYYTGFGSLLAGFAELKIRTVEAKNAERYIANLKAAAKELKDLGAAIGSELELVSESKTSTRGNEDASIQLELQGLHEPVQ